MGHVAKCCLDIGAGLAKGSKVFIFQQDTPSLVHQFVVQLIVQFQREVPDKRVLARMDVIMVGACNSRETSVHICADGFYPINANVLMKQSVQFVRQQLRVESRLRIEVGSHATGVYPCIGTSCSCDCHFLAQQQRQTTLQLALHRYAVGLYLPPVILRSVVAKPDKISHHSLIENRYCPRFI